MSCIALRLFRRRPRLSLLRLSPSNQISPESGFSSATTSRPRVVFPQPDSPTRPKVSPLAIERETLETAFTLPTVRGMTAPRVTGNSLTTSRMSTSGPERGLLVGSSLTTVPMLIPQRPPRPPRGWEGRRPLGGSTCKDGASRRRPASALAASTLGPRTGIVDGTGIPPAGARGPEECPGCCRGDRTAADLAWGWIAAGPRRTGDGYLRKAPR